MISNDRGIYVAPSLPVGDYEVKAELAGFKSFVRRGIRLEAESRLTVDIALEVGQISETVTVTEAVAPVQSETGEVSTLVSGTQVTELALNGRNFTHVPDARPRRGVAPDRTDDGARPGGKSSHVGSRRTASR